MSYLKATDILPKELVEMIQCHIDGECIYIPRAAKNRLTWGTNTNFRQEIQLRNQKIYEDYLSGYSSTELSGKYFLSQKSIQRILRQKRE